MGVQGHSGGSPLALETARKVHKIVAEAEALAQNIRREAEADAQARREAADAEAGRIVADARAAAESIRTEGGRSAGRDDAELRAGAALIADAARAILKAVERIDVDDGVESGVEPVTPEPGRRSAPGEDQESARLVAVSMAVGGQSRAEVAQRLHEAFGDHDWTGVLDSVFGGATPSVGGGARNGGTAF